MTRFIDGPMLTDMEHFLEFDALRAGDADDGGTATAFRISNGNLSWVFTGVGFSEFVNGVPTTGVVTGITFYYVDSVVVTLSEIIADIAPLMSDLAAGRWGNPGVLGQLFAHDDYISGGGWVDHLYGCNGDDRIFGGGASDFLHGDSGDDVLYGNADSDSLIGGKGNDRLIGGASEDLLAGETGDDTLIGGDHNDTLWGGAGDDLIQGGNGDDTMYGDAGINTFVGGVGNDIIYSFGQNDKITGGAGFDFLELNLTGESVSRDVVVNGAKVSVSGQNVLQIEQITLIGGSGDDTFTVLNPKT